MSSASVPDIKTHGISCHQPAHKFGKWMSASEYKHMEVIRHEAPCQAFPAGFPKRGSKAGKKVITIVLFNKNPAPLYSTCNHVIQLTLNVYSGLSWHKLILQY